MSKINFDIYSEYVLYEDRSYANERNDPKSRYTHLIWISTSVIDFLLHVIYILMYPSIYSTSSLSTSHFSVALHTLIIDTNAVIASALTWISFTWPFYWGFWSSLSWCLVYFFFRIDAERYTTICTERGHSIWYRFLCIYMGIYASTDFYGISWKVIYWNYCLFRNFHVFSCIFAKLKIFIVFHVDHRAV